MNFNILNSICIMSSTKNKPNASSLVMASALQYHQIIGNARIVATMEQHSYWLYISKVNLFNLLWKLNNIK